MVLGVNVDDDKTLTAELLRKEGVTYPNIHDTSEEAGRISIEVYGGGAVPMNYLIDVDGNIIDAWFCYDDDREKAIIAALEKQNKIR